MWFWKRKISDFGEMDGLVREQHRSLFRRQSGWVFHLATFETWRAP